jgi:hypothetical protein
MFQLRSGANGKYKIIDRAGGAKEQNSAITHASTLALLPLDNDQRTHALLA